MNKISLRTLAVALLAASFLLPRISRANGNDNPTGPTGEYNGSITTAGSYDPYTGNGKRFVEDLTVTGSVGAYPLTWTRILNTRQSSTAGFGAGGAWTHNYRWGLLVRPYREYDYEDAEYEGPDGQVTFPDGRTMPLDANPDGTYSPENIIEPPGRLVNMPGGNYDLILPDGGRVKFEHPPGVSGNYGCVATRIIDPHGQTTTIARDSAGRLSRITEPGGRFLQINYTTFSYPSPVVPGGIAHADVISSVQAFASEGNLTETVNYSYTYETVDYYRKYNLTQVNYGDNTQATYTYYPNSGPYGLSGGRMNTCRDVRYAGAMSNIKYEYATWTSTHQGAIGQIKREKNLTTGQVVSEVTYPPTHPESNDPSRFVRAETRGDGKTRSFQYSNDGNAELQSYTDFKNQRSYIGYGLASGGINYLRVFTDARGHRASTEKEWNAGAVMALIHHDNTSIRYTYSDPNNPYYVSSKTDERGYVTTHVRDPVYHRITQTNYPDQGYEQFTYNGFGQVLTHRMTSGGTETFTYDSRGLKTSSFPPATASDPDPWNHPTRYHYYQSWPHTDRLQRTVDPRGNATSYEYNLRGQVTKVMHQDATYTQSGYNPDGTLAWTADENHPNASWNVSERTRYTYDEYKRVLTVTNPMNETTTNSYAIDVNWAQPLLHTTNSLKYTNSPMGKNVVFDYDANFRKTSQVSALGTPDEAWTLFEYDAVGNLTKTTDPRFNVTTFGYDNRNRQVTVTDALNQTTTTTYDAANNKRSVTRPGNPPLQFTEYDPMNRLKKQIDEKGVPTRMEYDPGGNLAKNWDGNNNLYQYEYDALNRRTAMVYPDNSRESTTYDAAGNKKTYINRAGTIQTFFYDNRNRSLGFDWNDGYTPQQRTQYDAASRVTQIWNWDSTINFTYFDNNRLKTQQELTGSNYNHTISYAYDGDGNRQSITCPSTKVWLYAYNERNQLLRIMNTGLAVLVGYQYDRAGNRERRSLFNGTVTDFAPADPLNRSAWVRHSFNGVETGRFDYDYDQLNRLKYEQRNGGAADGYGYDPTDQVTSFKRDGVLSNGSVTGGSQVAALTYDLAGNRAQVTSNGATTAYVANNLNQYTSVNGAGITSDLKGNLKTHDGWTYHYDAQNRLRSAVKGGTTVEMWYDGMNRQITRRINGSAIIRSVWDGWNLLEERDGNDTPLAYYLHGAKTDELVLRWASVYGEDTWYAQDGRGNVSHVYNYGSFVERYTYGLAGEPRIFAPNGPERLESAIANRFMFTGRDYHKDLGIYDYRNRYYHPGLNRFLQTDPIGFKGDASNLYRYCGNDPVDRTDPMGLDWGFLPYQFPRNFDHIPEIVNKGANGVTVRKTFEIVWAAVPANGGFKIKYYDVNVRSQSYIRTHQRRYVGPVYDPDSKREDRRTFSGIVRTTFHEGRQQSIDHGEYHTSRGNGTFKRGIEDGKSYESPKAAEGAVQLNGAKARDEFESRRNEKGKALQEEDGRYQPPDFAKPRSAAEIDQENQATGVPSLGAEAVNYVNGRL